MVLEALTYRIELKRLDGFRPRFEEYRRLNDDVLSLVLENTNVKAQRLSFGPSSDAAEAFHRAIEAAAAGASDSGSYSAVSRPRVDGHRYWRFACSTPGTSPKQMTPR
jgi:hypothetical protein